MCAVQESEPSLELTSQALNTLFFLSRDISFLYDIQVDEDDDDEDEVYLTKKESVSDIRNLNLYNKSCVVRISTVHTCNSHSKGISHSETPRSDGTGIS